MVQSGVCMSMTEDVDEQSKKRLFTCRGQVQCCSVLAVRGRQPVVGEQCPFLLLHYPYRQWPVSDASGAIMSKANLNPASLWQLLFAHWRHHYLHSLNCPVFIVLAVSAGRRHRRHHHHARPFTLDAFFAAPFPANKVFSWGLWSYFFSLQRHCCCHLCPSFLFFLSLSREYSYHFPYHFCSCLSLQFLSSC